MLHQMAMLTACRRRPPYAHEVAHARQRGPALKLAAGRHTFDRHLRGASAGSVQLR